MNAAVQSAHTAYRSAAELAPERGPSSPVRLEFAPRRMVMETVDDPAWNDAVRWLNTEMEVRTDHLVAAGGAVFFLIAGLACGAWLQIA